MGFFFFWGGGGGAMYQSHRVWVINVKKFSKAHNCVCGQKKRQYSFGTMLFSSSPQNQFVAKKSPSTKK